MLKELTNMIKLILIIISYFAVNFLSGFFLFGDNPFSVVVFEFSYLFILFFIFRKDLVKEWKLFISKFDNNFTLAIRLWVLGVSLMIASNLILGYFIPSTESINETTIRSLIDTVPLTMFFSVIILAPLTEELIFRKTFQKLLPTSFVFFIMSTLTFSAVHVVGAFENWSDLTMIISYACIGGVITYSYIKTKTIYTPILIHLIHNGVSFTLYVLSTINF